MTITIDKDAGFILAICDKCGQTDALDARDRDEALEEIEENGWQHFDATTQRFNDGLHGSYKETYECDLCNYCKTDEPTPKPVFVNKPAPIKRADPMINDPCDEWVKPLIYKASGLAFCGHPKGVIPCPMCEREALTGRPVGR